MRQNTFLQKCKPPIEAPKVEWEIDRRSLQLTKQLGTGKFGETWEGVLDMMKPVAVKVLKTSIMSTEEFLKLAELMKDLSHPKLIQLNGVCTKEEPIYIVTELAKFGSLLDYLRGDGRSLKQCQRIAMCEHVAGGMAYLESQNCIHRDLAARNILVSEQKVCKVAGLRLACMLKGSIYEDKTHTKFAIKWTAPEVAKHHQFSIKSDVWSFGILLYEVITHGQPPYPGMTNAEVTKKLQQGYRMPRPQGCPEKLYQMMVYCWNNNADCRPTFETLKWQLEEFYTAEDLQYCEPAGQK